MWFTFGQENRLREEYIASFRTQATPRIRTRAGYSNLCVVMGSLSSNPRNEHTGRSRGAGVLAVSVFRRTDAGSNETGRPRTSQPVGLVEGGVSQITCFPGF